MDNIILAIETSIKAGSLALLNGANIIDSWTGNDDVSRSEDLIPQISRLLDKNQIRLDQLKKIAVSTGPGSFTGIRVGMAAAKALALSLDCRLIGVSILGAIASAENLPEAEEKVIAVSAGRDLYFWQSFRGSDALNEPETGDAATLMNGSDNPEKIKPLIIAEKSAYENLIRNNLVFLERIELFAGNHAELIGLCSVDKTSSEPNNVSPLYIRPAVVIKKKI